MTSVAEKDIRSAIVTIVTKGHAGASRGGSHGGGEGIFLPSGKG